MLVEHFHIKLFTQLYKNFGVNIPIKKLLNDTLETIEDELLTFLSSEQTSAQVSSIRTSNVQCGIYLECMNFSHETSTFKFIVRITGDIFAPKLSISDLP